MNVMSHVTLCVKDNEMLCVRERQKLGVQVFCFIGVTWMKYCFVQSQSRTCFFVQGNIAVWNKIIRNKTALLISKTIVYFAHRASFSLFSSLYTFSFSLWCIRLMTHFPAHVQHRTHLPIMHVCWWQTVYCHSVVQTCHRFSFMISCDSGPSVMTASWALTVS